MAYIYKLSCLFITSVIFPSCWGRPLVLPVSIRYLIAKREEWLCFSWNYSTDYHRSSNGDYSLAIENNTTQRVQYSGQLISVYTAAMLYGQRAQRQGRIRTGGMPLPPRPRREAQDNRSRKNSRDNDDKKKWERRGRYNCVSPWQHNCAHNKQSWVTALTRPLIKSPAVQ